MTESAQTLITIGALFLVGLATDALGRRTRLPRVTLLLLVGIAAGPMVLDLLPSQGEIWFPLVANTALALVGFLLGEHFTFETLRERGREVLAISLSAVLLTALLVGAGLWLLGAPLAVALLLAGIATATAPAATQDVVHEVNARGPFTRTLLGVVAVDDTWGLLLFSILLVLAATLLGVDNSNGLLLSGLREIAGAVALGLVLGVPMAYLTRQLPPGDLTLTEALGMVLLCAGLAIWIDVSFLLASVALGAVVANFGARDMRPFHALEQIEWPFMILFFVLAGAALDVAALPALGVVGGGYVVLRGAGRLLGSWIGGVLAAAPAGTRRWMGLALMPQAGVAIGMALVTSQRLPEVGGQILAIVVGATVLFELLGPILTRRALERVGELGEHP